MKLYQEVHLQAAMILSTVIGLIAVIVLMIAAWVSGDFLYMFYAAGMLLVVYPIIHFGKKRTMATLARMEKIRLGYGDETDDEWLKTIRKQ